MTSFTAPVESAESYRSFIELISRVTFLYHLDESGFTSRPIRSTHPGSFTKLVVFDLDHFISPM